MFSLEIYGDTPAIDADPVSETIRVLTECIEHLRDGRTTATTHDSHGQPCGWWELTHIAVPRHPEERLNPYMGDD
jgi:hypothetical protein